MSITTVQGPKFAVGQRVRITGGLPSNIGRVGTVRSGPYGGDHWHVNLDGGTWNISEGQLEDAEVTAPIQVVNPGFQGTIAPASQTIGVLVANDAVGRGWYVMALEDFRFELRDPAMPLDGVQKIQGTLTGRLACHSTLSNIQHLAYCVLASESDAKGPFLDEAQACLKERPDRATCPLRQALRNIISLLDGDSVPHPDSEVIRLAREALES